MTPWRAVVRRFWARRLARVALGWVGGMLLVASFADCLASDLPIATRFRGELYVLPNVFQPAALAPYDLRDLQAQRGPDDWLIEPLVPYGPNRQEKGTAPLAAPDSTHWLGTDTARRDVLARLIHGTRVALLVGVVSVAVYLLLGTALGLCAGYFGGATDAVVSRLVEVTLAVPSFFLVLAVLAMLERPGIATMMATLGLVSWPRVALLMRAETRRQAGLDYVRAAVALGYSPLRVMLRHILPNAMGPLLVAAAFGVGGAILTEATLSFLGFGTPDTSASWGGLLEGATGHLGAWWLVTFPGLCVFGAVAAYNLLGEALRDALDPRE